MFDAHAHYHDCKFDVDRQEVLRSVWASGVEAVVNVGTSVGESREAVELAEQFAQMYATVGIHPHSFNLRKLRQLDVTKLFRLAKKSESVVAIGETGLDYHSHSDEPISDEQKQRQLEGFVAQIELARQLNLPVVVHCRDAYVDCVAQIVANPMVRFVMHCYMGDEATTEQLLERGNVMFSFAGNVTYSKSDTDAMSKVLRKIPLERMMIETDAPYLAPKPKRGKRNDSTLLVHTATHIAQIIGVGVDELITVTTKNSQRFFDIASCKFGQKAV